MGSLYQQGAPIRFGVVLAPGASKSTGAAVRASPFEVGSGHTRLHALSEAYDAAWDADATVAKLTKLAADAPPPTPAMATGGGGGGGEESDAGAVVTSVEEDEEAKESAALGLLLTKLFIFCKRKGGNAAAMSFLSLTQEVREVGGFFGSHTEPLAEAHLRQAFEHALQRKKGVDVEAVYEGLKTGTLTDYDADAELGNAFVRDKGLEAPALLMNGVLTPLGAGLEQEIMQALNREVRAVQGLVRAKKITDATSDVYGAIVNASATFPRYNKQLLVAQDKVRPVAHPAPAQPRHTAPRRTAPRRAAPRRIHAPTHRATLYARPSLRHLVLSGASIIAWRPDKGLLPPDCPRCHTAAVLCHVRAGTE